MFSVCPERLLLLALMFGCAALEIPLNGSTTALGSDYNSTQSYDQGGPGVTQPKQQEDKNGEQETGITIIPFFGAGFPPPGSTKTKEQERQSSTSPNNHRRPETTDPDVENEDKEPVILSNILPNYGQPRGPEITPRYEDDEGRQNLSEEARWFLTGSLSTTIIPSFYTLVCLLSVPINICALLIFIKRIKPKKPAVIYMMNLACADLLFSMVLPFKISYHFMGNDWIFGRAMCRIVTAAFYWNMYCSVLLISLISVDRLLAVVYPFQSLSWRSPAKAVIACAAMWILSFVGLMHLLFTEQTFNLTELNITTCHDIQPSQPFLWYKTYYITLCLLLFFLPLIITMVSYTWVILTLSKVKPEVPDHSQKKRRAVFLTATVLVMFVLCFLPPNIVLLAHQLMYSEEIEDQEKEMNPDRLYVIYLVCLCLGSLNCILDPLVYYFGSSQFQKELSSMMGCQKTKQSTNGGRSPSGPSNTSRSTSQITVKSNSKKNATKNTLPINRDSSQGNLCSQYKKQTV
ncbi:proteinase-activated receptor 1-like [Cheilinus undulatus]|uniref:proteinase-activated receptor 1-like n=1 Tax=Cheilinus undulatus TaxID=241271 RepID=UPI001BD5321A|nr:proteinase-activated receptor 1-like [Cheilinus undulatus]XP_041667088.1 proteinase-activated receptor 1-like [Cheilinus undulatus]XP_041667089.1 proteinase-activated receptor 1-like [Cheilinus undulatus]